MCKTALRQGQRVLFLTRFLLWNKIKVQVRPQAPCVSSMDKMDIVWTNNDSKGNKIKAKVPCALIPKPYLSIKTKNGEIRGGD